MNNEEKVNRVIYWVGIAFIVWCVLQAMTAKADPDPCKFEYANAVSVCHALGRKSPECKRAVEDYRLCKVEKQENNDPLDGLCVAQRCETQCIERIGGLIECRTVCYDERGRRVS